MKKLKIFITALTTLCATSVFSHPHSFVDLKNKIILDGTLLKSFQMEWLLDEITSSELIYEIQTSPDQEKTRKDITAEMAQTAIQHHYFSTLYSSQNQPIKFTASPTDTSLEIKDKRAIFHITFHISKPYDLKQNKARFYTYEPSYYISMEYNHDNDVSISNANCKAALMQPQVDTKLRLYASGLDKNQAPEVVENEDYSLGAQFAQRVDIICN